MMSNKRRPVRLNIEIKGQNKILQIWQPILLKTMVQDQKEKPGLGLKANDNSKTMVEDEWQ